MNKLLTAGQTLTTLRKLRSVVQKVVQSEEELTRQRDQELEAVGRKYGLLRARARDRMAQAEAEASKAQETLRGQTRRRIEARQQWIESAAGRAKEALEARAEEIKSQQRYQNQKELLRANKTHEDNTKAAEKTLRGFLRELEAEEARFEDLRELAQGRVKGFYSFRALLRQLPDELPAEGRSSDEYLILDLLRKELGDTEIKLGSGFGILLLKVFSVVPLWGWILLLGTMGAGVHFLPQVLAEVGVPITLAWQVIGGLGGGVVLAYGLAFFSGRQRVREISQSLGGSLALIGRAREVARESHEQIVGAIDQELNEVESRLDAAWREARSEAETVLERGQEKLVGQERRLTERNEVAGKRALAQLDQVGVGSQSVHSNAIEALSFDQVVSEQTRLEQEIENRFQAGMSPLIDEWTKHIPVMVEQLQGSVAVATEEFPEWSEEAVREWVPPRSGEPRGLVGTLAVELDRVVERLPHDPQLKWEPGRSLGVPLAMCLPTGESVLFESESSSPAAVLESISGLIMRMLSNAPVGRMRLTFIDPVGLGQSFAGLMHLADFDEQLINRRIWTQSTQIEQCLRDLTEHMEKVTQMYLRNEYASLAEYNAAAGNIAEKYHVLVVADFPVGFSESALRRLQSIAVSGARCGVFLLLHRDRRQPLPDDAISDDLRQHCVWFEEQNRGYLPAGERLPGVRLEWAPQPEAKTAIDLIQRIGEANSDSNRVEVPFDYVAPGKDEFWSNKTASSLRVPIGRTGASKLQYLNLGKGTQQHVLIAGKTGSGKSTLFHVIVTNLALWCRPDHVEFYLVDFKKGVEFKCYAQHSLPHARVVAIESDREFGLSVLERVDQELRRRGDLFRERGVQDLPGYNSIAESKPLPRTLLMIDEFQEYFVEDDRVAQNAAVLLDRIVRQGRAFGIHVILGSQTLGGAYTLARTTLAQMVVRIALQCDEADSYLIMDENNAAPRLLSRPGEGIYNDSGGAVEGNSPFQTVWLSDAERDRSLEFVTRFAAEHGWGSGEFFVFEGNAPAHIEENRELEASLSDEILPPPAVAHAWLGAANAIKGPTRASFQRQSGSHLLILGQNEESALSLILSGLVSLASQYTAETAEFIVLDSIPEHSPQRSLVDRVLGLIPHKVTTLRDQNVDELMGLVGSTLDRRSGGEIEESTVFVVVIGLQNFKRLRPEDEFSFSSSDSSGEVNPGDVFDRVIREGAAVGIHAMMTVDSYNSSQRYLSRKALSEIEMRVLFQMSANDSAALIDSTKASQLGLHRALFYNERKGYLETFRPYATPGEEWLTRVEKSLSGRSEGVAAPTEV